MGDWDPMVVHRPTGNIKHRGGTNSLFLKTWDKQAWRGRKRPDSARVDTGSLMVISMVPRLSSLLQLSCIFGSELLENSHLRTGEYDGYSRTRIQSILIYDKK